MLSDLPFSCGCTAPFPEKTTGVGAFFDFTDTSVVAVTLVTSRNAGSQPTLFHSLHRLVLKYSPLLSVTRPGPSRLLLAMIEPNSPLASLARSQ